MGLFGRNGKEPGTELVPQGPVRSVDPDPIPESPEDTDFIWRCGNCGAMGLNRESLHAHLGKVRRGKPCEPEGIKHYVLAVEQEYEAKAAEVSASGVWIIIKLPDDTPEGEIKRLHYKIGDDNPWLTTVIEAASGLAAIQEWYSQKVSNLAKDHTEADREKCNGRYVAIDFFTGHRAEALVESEWRANVEVAEGSHV